MSQFTPEKFEKIYDKLDEDEDCNNFDNTRDKDFNPEEYIIGYDNYTGESIYHWDELAQEVDHEEFEAKSLNLPNFCKLSKRSLNSLYREDIEQLNERIRAYNIGQYKLMSPHPILEDTRINIRHYSSEEAQKKLTKYPGDMTMSSEVSRSMRWKEARSYKTLNSVKEQIKKDKGKCCVIGYSYDPDNNVFEPEGNNSINCMDSVIEKAMNLQKTHVERKEKIHLKKSEKKRKEPHKSHGPTLLIDENSSTPLYFDVIPKSKKKKSSYDSHSLGFRKSDYKGLDNEFWNTETQKQMKLDSGYNSEDSQHPLDFI
jgi:hypothetical protein